MVKKENIISWRPFLKRLIVLLDLIDRVNHALDFGEVAAKQILCLNLRQFRVVLSRQLKNLVEG